MTDRADYPLRTLRLCDSALKSQHPDGIPPSAATAVWNLELLSVAERRTPCCGGFAAVRGYTERRGFDIIDA